MNNNKIFWINIFYAIIFGFQYHCYLQCKLDDFFWLIQDLQLVVSQLY